MDMIERYIYAVTKRLPQKQRAEIEKELRGTIEEMMAEHGGDAEAVLRELGEPSKLADKYRDKTRYLVGPEYFDMYLMVLKIVLAATAFGMTIALIIGFFAEPPANGFAAIGEFTGSIISAMFGGFAWVTVIFALVEHFGVDNGKLSELRKSSWKPSDLPKIPVKSAVIRIAEPIIGIIVNVILLLIFNFSYKYIGAFFTSGGSSVAVPVFDPGAVGVFLPLIDVLFCISILKECAKLVAGRWTLPLALANIVINAVSLAVFFALFTNPAIWNPNFFTELARAGVSIEGVDLKEIWPSVTRFFLVFVTIAMLIDSAANLYKSLASRDSK